MENKNFLILNFITIFILFFQIFQFKTYASSEIYTPTPPTEEELKVARERRELWENNNLGKEEWVPPPWIPVKTEKQIVYIWGRKYIFDNSLFPVQIETNGKNILSRPIFLDVKTETGHEMVYEGEFKIISRTDEKVVIESDCEKLGLKFVVKTEIEFDGMAKVFLKISPLKKSIKIEKIALRIPVNQNYAEYYHWEGDSWDPSISYSGKIPDEGISGSFRYFVWVGDKERGIGWFASDKENWENKDIYEEIRIFKHEKYNDWNIRVNFIDSIYELKEPKTFIFGYQATPVKPVLENYRHLSFWYVWHWARGYLDPIPGEEVILNPTSKSKLQDVLKIKDNNYPLLVLAGGARALCDYKGHILPEQWLYSKEWSGIKDERINFPKNNWAGHVYYGPARLDTSFQDFMVYYINQLIENYNIYGFYFDGAGSPLWSAREFLKRVYKLIKKKYPENVFIVVHSSTSLRSPVLAFADFQVNGENFNAGRLKVGAHYTEVLPVDRIFAEYTPTPWGWIPYFLPEFDEYYRELIAPTREMIALLKVHDVSISGAWCHYPTFQHFRNVIKDFGIGETDFIGYWKNPISHTNPEIKISVYKHIKEKKILLFVSNLTDKVQETQISIDKEKIGFSPTEFTDIENDFPLTLNDNKLEVLVNSFDYRIIKIK